MSLTRADCKGSEPACGRPLQRIAQWMGNSQVFLAACEEGACQNETQEEEQGKGTQAQG